MKLFHVEYDNNIQSLKTLILADRERFNLCQKIYGVPLTVFGPYVLNNRRNKIQSDLNLTCFSVAVLRAYNVEQCVTHLAVHHKFSV